MSLVLNGIDRLEATAVVACRHCGTVAPAGHEFCCPGCAAAFDLVQAMGLGRYYERRVLDPALRPPRPDAETEHRVLRHVRVSADGTFRLHLMVDGLQCGACIWLIETVLARETGLIEGRVNMTTRRLTLAWRGEEADGHRFLSRIAALGYRLVPYDPAAMASADQVTTHRLLRCLGVAAFAASNLMLLSIGIWAGLSQGMGEATRSLMHWVSAVIAVPAIAYAGQPFFASAYGALSRRRTNMDVPISVGVVLVTTMSLIETIRGADHTYFDSAAALLFFLLIGRVLDHRARGQARDAAQQLIALRVTDVGMIAPDGRITRCAADQVPVGARVLVAMGERVGIDGRVIAGVSRIDQAIVTGESLPVSVECGSTVFAGSLNLGDPITLEVTASGEGTLLAECVRLIEAAEQGRGRLVVLADRVARLYTPVVHLAALSTLIGWLLAGVSLQSALLSATAVLIITCPCALALAVPMVQVVATGRLFRRAILLKSPTALERLADIDCIVFDKTGTLSEPGLTLDGGLDPVVLYRAARLAAASRHPLARALVAASQTVCGPVQPVSFAVEESGRGIVMARPDGDLPAGTRLGSAVFCGIGTQEPQMGPHLWYAEPGAVPVLYQFVERLRPDATRVIETVRGLGLAVKLVSGDQPYAVATLAGKAGIDTWYGGQSPVDKVQLLQQWRDEGHRILMVGDGLNDSPALATASVSMSPSCASDLSQTVADFVFQGASLMPVLESLLVARRAKQLIRQNFILSLGYNILMIPLAVLGFVTPWIAAAAMSSSSLIVLVNSLRLKKRIG